MSHPLCFPKEYRGSALGIHPGDHVRFKPDGRCGVMDEALPDGDALVTWDDGTYGTVKWHALEVRSKGSE